MSRLKYKQNSLNIASSYDNCQGTKKSHDQKTCWKVLTTIICSFPKLKGKKEEREWSAGIDMGSL